MLNYEQSCLGGVSMQRGQQMYLTRVEQASNLYRFYRMQIVRDLFGDWGLEREWGRIGSSGRCRTDWFATEIAAKDARFTLHMQKSKRGYE